VLQDWSVHTPFTNVNRTLEIATYLVVGGLTGYLIDRVRIEERRLREALARLRRTTRQIFEIEDQLHRADRLSALGQLTAGLAHEIRTPLASIQGAAEILADPSTQAARRAEFGALLIEETQRLEQVLGSVLDYARSQKTGGRPASDPRAVLDKVLTLLGKQMRNHRVMIETALPVDLPAATIPENLLQQVLLNVLLNALQAMPSGGTVRVEADKTGGRRTGGLWMAISDTGPGIPPDRASRIFEPFFTTKSQGTGLGLPIIQKILARHGGRIRLDTDRPTGARFVIDLPAAE
jgi:signal transduction histidine kinase